MSNTKSQASKLVAAGIAREVFVHETLGTFDIAGLRELIATDFPHIYLCAYASVNMVDGAECDAMAYMVANREVDQNRCRELTDEQLDDPLIFVLCPPGSNGEQETHLLVDGIHRLVERKRRGHRLFRFYLVPLKQAPTVRPEDYHNIEWGDKEVVPGLGLVDRKYSK